MEINKITQNTTEESFWDAHTLLNAQGAPDERPESPKTINSDATSNQIYFLREISTLRRRNDKTHSFFRDTVMKFEISSKND